MCAKTLVDLALVGLDRQDQGYDVHHVLCSELKAYTETPVLYVDDDPVG